jgi:hypothetical protein
MDLVDSEGSFNGGPKGWGHSKSSDRANILKVLHRL